MADDAVVRECMAALQASLSGSFGLLTLARGLLDRMEEGHPLSPDTIAEYRQHLKETEQQLTRLNAVIGQWAIFSSGPTTVQ